MMSNEIDKFSTRGCPYYSMVKSLIFSIVVTR
jgi:hypothetical protein